MGGACANRPMQRANPKSLGTTFANYKLRCTVIFEAESRRDSSIPSWFINTWKLYKQEAGYTKAQVGMRAKEARAVHISADWGERLHRE